MAAAIAAIAGNVVQSVQGIFMNSTYQRLASEQADMLEMNQFNTNMAIGARQAVTSFNEQTASLSSDASNELASTAGIGAATQNTQLTSNINAAVTENSSALQERAIQQTLNSSTANTQNQANFQQYSTNVVSNINTSFAAGGLIGGLIGGAIVLSQGGFSPTQADKAANATATNVNEINQDTGYGLSGRTDPTSLGHADAISDITSMTNVSIDTAMSDAQAEGDDLSWDYTE